MRYSQKFKERMIRQMVGVSRKSAHELGPEVGVSQSTLSKWLRDSIEPVSEPKDDTPESETSDNPLKMAQLALQAGQLEGAQLGAFLRKHGLHHADLERWTAWLERGPTAPPTKNTAKQDKKRIKQLERELKRKDKALAETAALLVLQKKVQAIWGDEDEGTNTSNES